VALRKVRQTCHALVLDIFQREKSSPFSESLSLFRTWGEGATQEDLLQACARLTNEGGVLKWRARGGPIEKKAGR
jgi:hypothetical protein